MRKSWLVIFGLTLLVSACATLTIPDAFVYKETQTNTFRIAGWQKITNPNATYKVYIEGDGHAFNAHGRPTNNPTPKGTLVREMAFGDANENVIYLARPCQYVKDEACKTKYWTTARFAKEVIDDEYEVIKKIAGNNPVILIGFSGGAQVAGLIAVTKPDLNVKKIITVAGNLDHKKWTEYHHLQALDSSLDLNDYQDKFHKINQINYIGEKDKVIPMQISKDFLHNQNIYVVKNATHGEGWQSVYDKIRNEK